MIAILVMVGPIFSEVMYEFDARTMSSPSYAVPPWSSRGHAMEAKEGYLLQDWTGDDPKTSYGTYRATRVPGLMNHDSGEYGIEFRIRPLDDMPYQGGSHYANLRLAWGDNKHTYNVSIDRDSDDNGPGMLGCLRCGKNSMTIVAGGIDWSEAHTIFVGYTSQEKQFDFYVDGIHKDRIGAEKIAGEYQLRMQDILNFGDSTTGQPAPFSIDLAAEWYFIRTHDSAELPEISAKTGADAKSVNTAWEPLDGIGLYCGALDTEEKTVDFIAKCNKYGIGYLIASVAGGGNCWWKTDKLGHRAKFNEQMARGYDGLAILVKHAHAADIKVYPSVAVLLGGPIIAKHPEWETRDRQGQLASKTTSRALAMSYPGARGELVAAVMDLVNGYDIDGIFLDYCRYPENTKKPEYSYGWYGYDQPIIDACLNIYGFDPRTETINSANWNIFNEMRSASIVSFIREFRQAIDQSGKKLRFMGFGSRDPELEARSCGRNNIAWAQQGLIDDYIMGIYPDPISEMKAAVQKVRKVIPAHIGVYSSLSPFQKFIKTNDEMRRAAEEQLSGGADGIWIYRSDFLEQLDLWEGAKAAAELQKKHRQENPALNN